MRTQTQKFQSPCLNCKSTARVTARVAARVCFNPRVPRGTRLGNADRSIMFYVFQSPRPTRDATPGDKRKYQTLWGFNPRVPRGTRPKRGAAQDTTFIVSIPASHAGRDPVR